MKENLKKYRSCLFVTVLLAFLVHGAKLNAGIIGIDTEDLLHLQDDFYGGWLHTGRQGLVFLKYVLGNAHFNPYFAGSMTLLLFGAAVAAFLWLWDRTGGKTEEGLAWGCGSLLWISHPAMAEQFYFSLQSMEICLAMVLTAAALYLSFQWVDRHAWRYALGSVGILLLVFSVYQSFVVMYIFGIVAMLLLQALREASEGAEVRTGAYVRRVALHCGLFLAAFLLNTLITRLFFGSSSYLENQIFWGHASVKDCLHGIAGHVVKAFTGYDSVFYHWGLGLLAAADLGLLLWFLKGSGRKGRKNGGVVLFFLRGAADHAFSHVRGSGGDAGHAFPTGASGADRLPGLAWDKACPFAEGPCPEGRHIPCGIALYWGGFPGMRYGAGEGDMEAVLYGQMPL